MNDAKRPLLLPWIHTIIVAVILAIPIHMIPRYLHDRLETHAELPTSSLLREIMGFVQWIQYNIVLVVMILGVFSVDYCISNRLESRKAKTILTSIITLSAIVFVAVLMYLFRKEMVS